MKIIVFIYLIVFCSIGVAAQNYINYYNQANEAEFEFVEGGNLKTAKNTLRLLDKKYKRLIFKDNFYLGVLLYLDNDSVEGFKYLAKFIENYGSSTHELSKCKKKFQNLNISNKAISELKSLEQKITLRFKDSIYFNKIIKSVNDSIEYYLKTDQDNLRNDIATNDEPNIKLQTHFLNYLTKFGIPKIGLFSEDYTIILYHISDKKLHKMYLDFFLNELKKGNTCPYNYATLIDNNLIGGDETVYGSNYIKFSAKTNHEQVKVNRKKIGLSLYYPGPNCYPILSVQKQK